MVVLYGLVQTIIPTIPYGDTGTSYRRPWLSLAGNKGLHIA